MDTNNGTEAMNKLFKYKFMPRRKSFTLSALITLLSDRFLPDLYRNYVLQNVKGLPMYRAYSDFVPEYLHGKPRSLILHCLERKTKANRYDDDDIISTDEDGIFRIRKGDDFKYTINFLQPSCTCKDWIRWQIPCKHFFAVFRLKKEWGWNALPTIYRESPYLQSDSDAILDYFADSGDLHTADSGDHHTADSLDHHAADSGDLHAADSGDHHTAAMEINSADTPVDILRSQVCMISRSGHKFICLLLIGKFVAGICHIALEL